MMEVKDKKVNSKKRNCSFCRSKLKQAKCVITRIGWLLLTSSSCKLSLSEICGCYEEMNKEYDIYTDNSLNNTIRHCLSTYQCFENTKEATSTKRGKLWTINENYKYLMMISILTDNKSLFPEKYRNKNDIKKITLNTDINLFDENISSLDSLSSDGSLRDIQNFCNNFNDKRVYNMSNSSDQYITNISDSSDRPSTRTSFNEIFNKKLYINNDTENEHIGSTNFSLDKSQKGSNYFNLFPDKSVTNFDGNNYNDKNFHSYYISNDNLNNYDINITRNMFNSSNNYHFENFSSNLGHFNIYSGYNNSYYTPNFGFTFNNKRIEILDFHNVYDSYRQSYNNNNMVIDSNNHFIKQFIHDFLSIDYKTSPRNKVLNTVSNDLNSSINDNQDTNYENFCIPTDIINVINGDVSSILKKAVYFDNYIYSSCLSEHDFMIALIKFNSYIKNKCYDSISPKGMLGHCSKIVILYFDLMPAYYKCSIDKIINKRNLLGR